MFKMVDYQVDIIKVLVIFYLLIYSAQIDSIFSCLKISKISNNKIVQYNIIFILFILYYIIDLIYDYYTKLFKYNKNKKYYWFTYKNIKLIPITRQHLQVLNSMNIYVFYIIEILFIIGFILYLKEVHSLIKKKNSFYDIIFDNYCNLK